MRKFTFSHYNLYKDNQKEVAGRKNSLPNRKWTGVKVTQKPRELKKSHSSVMQKFNDEYKRAPYSTPEILTLMYNKKRNRFSNQNISLDCFTAGVRLTDIDQLNFEIRKFASKTNLRRAEKNNYACHIVIWLI